jgi:hypothetical protein
VRLQEDATDNIITHASDNISVTDSVPTDVGGNARADEAVAPPSPIQVTAILHAMVEGASASLLALHGADFESMRCSLKDRVVAKLLWSTC